MKSSARHRLHYRWTNLEADRCAVNIGSSALPAPSVDRRLRLEANREYDSRPRSYSHRPHEQRQFRKCEDWYNSIDYNTFCKNGCLKLTEIEMHFLSSKMTRASSHHWAVVYLGVGFGDRFRYLRDRFFSGLSVIAFDPVDRNYRQHMDYALHNAESWNNDGTNFTFLVRCFDIENDIAWIQKKLHGKRLLLISDLRGENFLDDGMSFDKEADQDLQLKAIQLLSPESSLVKFAVPDIQRQFFKYAPGVILKQVYDNYGGCEVRLLIEGSPSHYRWYNGWEISEKMSLHHEYLRGLVYETEERPCSSACLDSSFDCTVLWETLCTYAAWNREDPGEILKSIIKAHITDPPCPENNWGRYESCNTSSTSAATRWWQVLWSLQRGKIVDAIAWIESEDAEAEITDWADLAYHLRSSQTKLAEHLERVLHRPSSGIDLIRALGSLADSYTLLKTQQNGLLDQ